MSYPYEEFLKDLNKEISDMRKDRNDGDTRWGKEGETLHNWKNLLDENIEKSGRERYYGS